jgi:hypothetical protein
MKGGAELGEEAEIHGLDLSKQSHIYWMELAGRSGFVLGAVVAERRKRA